MSHDQSTTSPYRKVSTCTWADKKVRALSSLLPSGQALFIMLMIGPQTTNIPGVQPVGRLAFAEMLDWEQEAFDKAFAEVYREGLAKADWKARFVFVPKAILHNLPQSPNVVKSWALTWERIPDCDLKREAWETIYAAMLELGDSFANAFRVTCPIDFSEKTDLEQATGKATGKPSGKATGKTTDNKEKEKEKESIFPDGKIDGAGAPACLPAAPLSAGEPAGQPTPAALPEDPSATPPEASPPVRRSGDKLPIAIGVRELVAEGVARQHAEDWLKARRAKNLPLTPTALAGVKREADKAGIAFPQAVARAASEGWAGFKAAWLLNAAARDGGAPPVGAHGGFDQRDYGAGGML